MRLLLLIFLGTLTLIRRAQKNIFTRLETNPSSLLGILPQDDGFNLRNSVEEGNIQRVVAILQGNIKQWSFIEAQLLEPNVNLGMPEIFIPLKHLTTTLEILGNIFFMRNELEEAKNCLERACPLMELLPASLLDNFEASGVNFNIVNEYGFMRDNEIDESLREQMIFNDADDGKNYAEDCFSLLRNVYSKLYRGASQRISKSTRYSPEASAPGEFVDDELSEEKLFSKHYDDFAEYDDEEPEGIAVHSESENEPLDVESKIEELRIPFQHLRSELQMIQDRSGKHVSDETPDDLLHFDDRDGEESVDRFRVKSIGRMKKKKKKRGSAYEESDVDNPLSGGFSFRDLFFGSSHHRGLEDREADLNAEPDSEMSVGPASIIASDLEAMLRKFVKEDEEGRLVLMKVARKYYDDLDIHFPMMEKRERDSVVDLAGVFLGVMQRVIDEGSFEFIGKELEKWQYLSGGAFEDDESSSSFGSGVIWVAGSHFDALSTTERNQMLVLSAFDIALNLEPYEDFDISLGFELGIVDNERDRGWPGAVGSQSPSKSAEKTALPQRRKKTGAGKAEQDLEANLYEDQTPPNIGLSGSLRSSVPMLKLENDWMFILFVLFLVITAAVVYLSYQESLKKRIRQRPRAQKKGASETIVGTLFRPFVSSDGTNDGSAGLAIDWGEVVSFGAGIVANISETVLDLFRLLKQSVSRALLELTKREQLEMKAPPAKKFPEPVLPAGPKKAPKNSSTGHSDGDAWQQISHDPSMSKSGPKGDKQDKGKKPPAANRAQSAQPTPPPQPSAPGPAAPIPLPESAPLMGDEAKPESMPSVPSSPAETDSEDELFIPKDMKGAIVDGPSSVEASLELYSAEEYESLVSSFLSEGEWKEAKKKPHVKKVVPPPPQPAVAPVPFPAPVPAPVPAPAPAPAGSSETREREKKHKPPAHAADQPHLIHSKAVPPPKFSSLPQRPPPMIHENLSILKKLAPAGSSKQGLPGDDPHGERKSAIALVPAVIEPLPSPALPEKEREIPRGRPAGKDQRRPKNFSYKTVLANPSAPPVEAVGIAEKPEDFKSVAPAPPLREDVVAKTVSSVSVPEPVTVERRAAQLQPVPSSTIVAPAAADITATHVPAPPTLPRQSAPGPSSSFMNAPPGLMRNEQASSNVSGFVSSIVNHSAQPQFPYIGSSYANPMSAPYDNRFASFQAQPVRGTANGVASSQLAPSFLSPFPSSSEGDYDGDSLLKGMLDDILRPASPPASSGFRDLYGSSSYFSGFSNPSDPFSFSSFPVDLGEEDEGKLQDDSVISDLSPHAAVFQPSRISARSQQRPNYFRDDFWNFSSHQK